MVTSGPAACAMPTPNGNCVFTAVSSAAVLALALMKERRLMRFPVPFPISFAILDIPLISGGLCRRRPVFPRANRQNKKPPTGWRADESSSAFPQCSGVACRPVVGPAALLSRAPFAILFTSRVPTWTASKMVSIFNGLGGWRRIERAAQCRMISQSAAVNAKGLCSAQNAGSGLTAAHPRQRRRIFQPSRCAPMWSGSKAGPVKAPTPSAGSPAGIGALVPRMES